MPEFRVPVATYRLQFNSQFKFEDARRLVPYLSRLGVTDIYASPIFKARQGSLHGYDVTDPAQLNPELGTDAEFKDLVREIKENNLGLLLDIVPNHMAVSPENLYLMDVLKNGLDSPYAQFFDIDWLPCGGAGESRLILPFLSRPYIRALEEGEIRLGMEDSSIYIRYYDIRLPLSLKSYPLVLSFRMNSAAPGRLIERTALDRLKRLIKDMETLPEAAGAGKSKENISRIAAVEREFKDLVQNSSTVKEFILVNIALINGQKGDPRSFDRLDSILNRQFYRLTFWKTGLKDLNYRRFFDVSSLISLRTELPEVFQSTHARVLQMVKEGAVTGLRIDHIDGLYDPRAYLARVRRHTGRFYVIVEKILSDNEVLPGDWPVYGTTGYDFSREVNNVFVDSGGMLKLDEHYSQTIQRPVVFSEVVYEKKKQIIRELFPGELRSLSCRLFALAGRDRYARDLTEEDISQALIEVTAGLPVYRTYTRSFEISPTDRRYLEIAFAESRRRSAPGQAGALSFLRKVLFLEFPPGPGISRKRDWLHLVMKWQQFTGPVTAKGLEDTALYNYNRLISLNIVGASLEQKEWSVNKFHEFNISRQTHWPLGLNATSTHDAKRSEDVRARINVLSEKAREWAAHVSRWRRWNHGKKKKWKGRLVPDANTEEFLYQTLVGAWPFYSDEIPDFRERFKNYMLKSAREARVFTGWIQPDETYEKSLISFIEAILDDSEGNEFWEDFTPFQRDIAFYGALNSLGQTLLKITSPGVPDFYQGMETWDLSLVDPDNRRPVDFALRQKLLDGLADREKTDREALLREIRDHWQDGRIKLYITTQGLSIRRKLAALFRSGDYIPLRVEGKRQENVIAFLRHWRNNWAVIAVPRLSTKLVQPRSFPLGKEIWGWDRLILPEDAPGTWQNGFTGETIESLADKSLLLARAFDAFPVALLHNSF